jgi:hypothetical protein
VSWYKKPSKYANLFPFLGRFSRPPVSAAHEFNQLSYFLQEIDSTDRDRGFGNPNASIFSKLSPLA